MGGTELAYGARFGLGGVRYWLCHVCSTGLAYRSRQCAVADGTSSRLRYAVCGAGIAYHSTARNQIEENTTSCRQHAPHRVHRALRQLSPPPPPHLLPPDVRRSVDSTYRAVHSRSLAPYAGQAGLEPSTIR
eukprot:744653-Rhodomonas_salina.3